MAGLTPLGMFMKWFGLPAGLALAGYFLVGPRIGKDALDHVRVPAGIKSVLTKPVAPAAADPQITARPTRSEPNLEVSVLPVSEPPHQERPRPRHRRKPAPAATVVAPPPQSTAPAPGETGPPPIDDPGGSGGASTAGESGTGTTGGATTGDGVNA